MRTLKRNKQKFYYSNYVGKEELVDEWGNATGEYNITYSEPKLAEGNFSASRGLSEADQFGVSINYNKVLVVEEDLGLTETSILWIEKPITEEHDYVIAEVAKSINGFSYAIRKVDVQ